jgi:hypothetical protein
VPGDRCRGGREVRGRAAADPDGAGGAGQLDPASAGGGAALGGEHGPHHCYGRDRRVGQRAARSQHRFSYHREFRFFGFLELMVLFDEIW